MQFRKVLTILFVLLLSISLSSCPLFPRGRLRGSEPQISIFMHETGEKRSIRLEDYLKGVVAAEMEPDWPVEALAAQAIIARTFTVERLENGGGVRRLHGTDVCNDETHLQAYDPGRITDQVIEAVDKTRGLIAVFQGRPVRAWFHASSGGKTATPGEGLGFDKEATPYLRSIEDPMGVGKETRWEASFTQGEVATALSGLGKNIGSLESAEVAERGPSGRAISIRLNDLEVPANQLRFALGPERMRSTLIDELRVEGNNLVMIGKGFGHGVGMSQWGARNMAEAGKSCEEIVKFYYKDVTFERRWQ
ncbi:MAG: SpoIID/LytB domain-containing protein [Bacillota bacterium]